MVVNTKHMYLIATYCSKTCVLTYQKSRKNLVHMRTTPLPSPTGEEGEHKHVHWRLDHMHTHVQMRTCIMLTLS